MFPMNKIVSSVQSKVRLNKPLKIALNKGYRISSVRLPIRVKEINVLYKIHAHCKMASKIQDVFMKVTKDLLLAFSYPDISHARIVFDGKIYECGERKKQLTEYVVSIVEPIVIRGLKRGAMEIGYTKILPEMSQKPFSAEEKKLMHTVCQVLIKHVTHREIIERHEKIVNKAFTGIYLSDKGKIKYANARMSRMFGYSEAETMDKDIGDIILNCSHTRNPSKIASGHHCKTIAVTKTGQQLNIELGLQRISYHGRNAVLGRVSDITALTQAQEKLKDFNRELKAQVAEKTKHLQKANARLQSLNQLKDEFIAVTSHELRSPLTSIRGYLSFLVEPDSIKELPADLREYVTRAYENTESLNRLVNNILDVSRLEMGRFELHPDETDLVKLAEDILKGVAVQAYEKKLKLELINSTGTEKLFVNLDSIRVSQVLRNLLDNAIKFSNKGTAITVELRIDAKFVSVEVTDRGVGIPKSNLDDIFNKFIQVKNNSKHYSGGAGLGLYIAKKIVELHGGMIEARCDSGKGTTIQFTLPL